MSQIISYSIALFYLTGDDGEQSGIGFLQISTIWAFAKSLAVRMLLPPMENRRMDRSYLDIGSMGHGGGAATTKSLVSGLKFLRRKWMPDAGLGSWRVRPTTTLRTAALRKKP